MASYGITHGDVCDENLTIQTIGTWRWKKSHSSGFETDTHRSGSGGSCKVSSCK